MAPLHDPRGAPQSALAACDERYSHVEEDLARWRSDFGRQVNMLVSNAEA